MRRRRRRLPQEAPSLTDLHSLWATQSLIVDKFQGASLRGLRVNASMVRVVLSGPAPLLANLSGLDAMTDCTDLWLSSVSRCRANPFTRVLVLCLAVFGPGRATNLCVRVCALRP